MIKARLLADRDVETLDAFLQPHTPFAYFMRSNACRGGMVFHGEPYQSSYFGAFNDGVLCGALAHSWMGSVQYFSPEAEAATPLATAWRAHLNAAPRDIMCFLGPANHIMQLHTALGFTVEAFREGGQVERLMTLDLPAMAQLPLSEGLRLRHAASDDMVLLSEWRYAFNIESLGDSPNDDTRKKANNEIARRIGEGDLFVLERHGTLVSFCGAGGFLPDWKMIGPVWTPPEERNKGYARLCVGGALAMVQNEGAKHAVLFTNNPAAEKAYRALGFSTIGDWRLDFLSETTDRL